MHLKTINIQLLMLEAYGIQDSFSASEAPNDDRVPLNASHHVELLHGLVYLFGSRQAIHSVDRSFHGTAALKHKPSHTVTEQEYIKEPTNLEFTVHTMFQ